MAETQEITVAAFHHGNVHVALVDLVLLPDEQDEEMARLHEMAEEEEEYRERGGSAKRQREPERTIDLPQTGLLLQRAPGGRGDLPGEDDGEGKDRLLLLQKPFMLTVAVAVGPDPAPDRLTAFRCALWNKYRCAKSIFGIIARVDGCTSRDEQSAARALAPLASPMVHVAPEDALPSDRGRAVRFTGPFLAVAPNFITSMRAATSSNCALPADLLALASADRWCVLELALPNYHAARFVAWCIAAQGMGAYEKPFIAGMPSALLMPVAGRQYVRLPSTTPFDVLLHAQLPSWSPGWLLVADAALRCARDPVTGAPQRVALIPSGSVLTDDMAVNKAAEIVVKFALAAVVSESRHVRRGVAVEALNAWRKRVKECCYQRAYGIAADCVYGGSAPDARILPFGFLIASRHGFAISTGGTKRKLKEAQLDVAGAPAADPDPKRVRRQVVQTGEPAPVDRKQRRLSSFFQPVSTPAPSS